jgi:hypothetical protein
MNVLETRYKDNVRIRLIKLKGPHYHVYLDFPQTLTGAVVWTTTNKLSGQNVVAYLAGLGQPLLKEMIDEARKEAGAE